MARLEGADGFIYIDNDDGIFTVRISTDGKTEILNGKDWIPEKSLPPPELFGEMAKLIGATSPEEKVKYQKPHIELAKPIKKKSSS